MASSDPPRLIDAWFDYHPPQGDQAERYTRLCQGAKQFAELIIQTCPEGTGRMVAIQRLREVMLLSCAAVASATEDQLPGLIPRDV